MKARFKSEIAYAAGISSRTLQRWFVEHEPELSALGVKPQQRLLPPKAVMFVCDELGIIESDFWAA